MGYRHVPTVEAPGAMAHRGGILDIYPPSSDLPVRIELWGDTIDNIRLYDPQTQRSVRLVQEIRISPAREYLLAAAQGQRPELDLSGLAPEQAERYDRELGQLAAGQPFDGMDFYAPLFPAGHLLDYLPGGALLVWDEPEECATALEEYLNQLEEMRRGRVSRGELPPDFPLPSFTFAEMSAGRSAAPGFNLARWAVEDAPGADEGDEAEAAERVPRTAPGEIIRLPFGPATAYGGRLRQALRDLRTSVHEGRRALLVSHQAARLSELLEEEDLPATPVEAVTAPPQPGTLILAHGSLGGGWTLRLTESERAGDQLVLMTDAEVFGFAKEPARPLRRRAAVVRRDNPLAGLKPGDYVVHVEHGIGRFGGMTSGVQDGIKREYIQVNYAEGDRLFVPVEQSDRLSRYVGPSGGAPSLTRLGSQEWTRAKERVQKATAQLARQLLATQASRQVAVGHEFAPDTAWQQELEASFPYVETPDQLEVLRDVKEDMQRPRPMDRLICGDVGYGKTEVALRAAFKAVQDGMQVAVLAPTTVLAQQHYSTFTQRLAAFPVTVDVLSRFRTDKEATEVLVGLKEGSVDICIGTHRLLQKDIAFKNLGLVIIDEEQRFGVLHKEHLKQLREGVDVLTMTATPIPRTLHMAMVGVRDMSTIDTPPEDRLAVRTYVMETNDRIIREAILRELERGGQAYFASVWATGRWTKTILSG
ncbi:MAG: DEAD/DEAH box helicase, partial [Chloroflexi bacterium]|nr:DEAD/DEAH box helicase [Chloroflexota bacterium]